MTGFAPLGHGRATRRAAQAHGAVNGPNTKDRGMSVATIEPPLEATLDPIRHDWSLQEVQGLFAQPFMDLILRAQRVHRAWHVPNAVQMSTLLSIKTGACPEDCAYCPQSVRYDTGVVAEALMPVAAVRECAARAKAAGATRFCMGAAYRAPRARELEVIVEMIRAVRALGLESCATLGMLSPQQTFSPAARTAARVSSRC